MKKSIVIGAVLIVALLIIFGSSAYTVGESEQAVIVQFGKVVDQVTEPGLHFKTPFIQEARKYEKRWLEWDGDPNQITTRDKRYIAIDVFARWRIDDLNVFVEKLNNETRAQSRLDDIIDSATRNVIANHNLIEAIRTTNRQFVESDEEAQASGEKQSGEIAPSLGPPPEAADDEAEEVAEAEEAEQAEEAKELPPGDAGVEDEEAEAAAPEEVVADEDKRENVAPTKTRMSQDGGAPSNDSGYAIKVGRQALTRLILEKASLETAKLGIELKDVQIKRIDYIASVQAKVFDRMISERRRVAEAYRSQGQGLSEILGQKERELKSIRSEAYKQSEEIKGRADAEAANIYARAYNRDPELYQFLKTLESYRQTVDEETWLLLTTEADYAHHMSEIK